MAITVANSVLTHKHIAELRSIWQNQMSYHVTELRVRMNDATCIGRATWLRIKQGQLNCKSRHCITDLNSSRLTRFKVTHNLAYKIIAAAKELNVILHSNKISESLKIHAKGTEIVDLLSDKGVQSFCNEKKMRIIVVEQQLDSSHSFLLTWGQLRKCKLSRATGRKPTWFAEIEQKLLDGPDTRRIKTEWQQEKRNDLAPRAELLKISTDKRKKEWIVFKTKGIMEFGRIVKKSDKSWIEIEHWHTEKDDLAYATRLKKCNGCHLNENSYAPERQCIVQRQLRSKKHVLQSNWVKKVKETGDFMLEIPLESIIGINQCVLITKDTPIIGSLPIPTIKIATREEELIDTHVEESQTTEHLRLLARQIKGHKEVIFYMDGSMTNPKGKPDLKKMGLDWVVT